MKTTILPAIYLTLVMTLLTGLLYPLAMTGIAQLVFPKHANGSLVAVDGRVVGSEFIGQDFRSNKYFWSRPSAILYDPIPSGASDFGPTSDTLKSLVEDRKANFIRLNHLPSHTAVPAEMIYASGSGLDPDISPEAAELQIDRVAKARGFNAEERQKLIDLVESHIESPELGLLGEPRVNVLLLNLAVDAMNVSRK